MRIAAIADVHGNIFALDAVLDALAKEKVDALVNLGDHLSGGVAPAETAERLMGCRIPTVDVRGNHERQVLEAPPEDMGESDRLAFDQLENHHRLWLARMPLTAEVGPGVLAFHGTPTSDTEYLLETVTPEGARPAEPHEVEERLVGHLSYDLLLCGHTHLQRAVELQDGPLVVNPGSVGYPAYDANTPYPHVMESGTPHAQYALIEDRSGQWQVDFRSVEYDWGKAARLARRNGRDDVEYALRTGRVQPHGRVEQ